MRKHKKIIIIISFFILGIISFFVGMGISVFKSMINKVERTNIDNSNLGINGDLDNQYNDIKNIALFGVDSTENSGRSDSIMILTINNKDNKLKITSLMRDSYVSIDGHGKDKLNHAYAFGGPELAVRTINENFDLNISDFITVNFSSLPKVIDAVGGVEIDVDGEELKFINDYINDLNFKNKTNYATINKTGLQHLNGTQAMAYCRIRYTSGGDYKRSDRHREVLENLIQKSTSISVLKYPELLSELLPMLKTSLSSGEIMNYGVQGVKLVNSLEQDRYPKDENSEEAMINNVYYLKFDERATIEALHNWIFN
ncbi:LCP family protein [Clostridium sp.]|uniref:LCP family protein n=1 Tax=Clostridium sp. TaxID=1506 RepID=UPI003991DB02